eukprot:scaffold660695_cov67-Prasinocladus_malaysianus.AAC.1
MAGKVVPMPPDCKKPRSWGRQARTPVLAPIEAILITLGHGRPPPIQHNALRGWNLTLVVRQILGVRQSVASVAVRAEGDGAKCHVSSATDHAN